MGKWAIGLMSGTSLDGIDAALIKSDGVTISEFGPSITIAYEEDFRQRLRGVFGEMSRTEEITELEEELTLRHADAVMELLRVAEMLATDIEVIGFHGQTIMHDPSIGRTWQLGNGTLLASRTHIPVVYDFRTNDVASGGEGAPLAPVYHQALAKDLEKPVAFLNIGGVANVTVVGEGDSLLAFDTGPGNALIDDFLLQRTGQGMDLDGVVAASGTVDQGVVDAFLKHEFFAHLPPKSLDRGDFDGAPVSDLSVEDGAATLTAMTVAAIKNAQDHMPVRPVRWLVCGGGRRNPTIMNMLARMVNVPVEAVEAEGWDGDALEAQAFAFMALRHIDGLPLSFPTTTNAPFPLDGGVMVLPRGLSD